MKHLYPQSDFRTMTDIDIFVNKCDFNKVTDVFLKFGFTKVDNFKNNEIHFKKDLLYIEVQSNLNDNNDTFFDSIWDNAEKRENYNYSYSLNREYFYLYMIYHCAHHFKTGGLGIRMLMDIYVYLSKYNNLNNTYINNSLKELKLLTFEKEMRNLSFNWFSLEDTSINDLGEFILYCSTYGMKDIFFYQDSQKQGSMYLLKSIFPSYKKMRNIYSYLYKLPFLLPFSWLQYWFTRFFFHRDVKVKEGMKSRINSKSYENGEFVSNLMKKLNI